MALANLDDLRPFVRLRNFGIAKALWLLSFLIVGYLVRAFQERPAFPAAVLVGPLVTIFVGFQIQSVLRREVELSKVPIEVISDLCKRVADLLANCLKQPLENADKNDELTKDLRSLSNEVTWLAHMGNAVGCDPALGTLLVNAQVDVLSAFKESETDQIAAERAGHRLRARVMVLQGAICLKVLEAAADPKTLAALLAKIELAEAAA